MQTITSEEAASRGQREPLWTLFRVVLGLSALSWGGLALMAQLEHHYVEREGRLSRIAFSDLIALAWMVPGPVGCNVAVQLGHALRGRAGAWVAGIASVLPFFTLMTLFAIFYRTPLVHAVASQTLLHHFSVVLATLIAVTWYKQTRALVRGKLEGSAALLGCIALFFAHSPAAYVVMLGTAFGAGWFASAERATRLNVSLARGDYRLLTALAILLVLFAVPLSPRYELALLWPRLAGAGMTLFGGGFSALPVLKTLFVTPAIGVSDNDFTLAFSLSPLSPGPLLNVVPFFGYLIDGWAGALLATLALFVPSGALVVLAQRHLHRLKANPRFEHGMRMLRAVTTAFLAVAVLKIAAHMPLEPVYLLTALFSALCFARLKVPVYVVYGTVALVCGVWLAYHAAG
ncbi:chromate transporter [Paraburkholderia sp. MMS20-SJTR3]|uniref:Chromate transporter n=1 Tax=Paraburkholderia sejongensis TaxID=2886946 RepID=A0ABS8K2B8_9BURK|nr:chromate transporter [Paraburkholderia sp. MMS20-SJTR3]MCC8396304.1 chromate transporter [Paraburkholderia sp. MMS20-SJTR3]